MPKVSFTKYLNKDSIVVLHDTEKRLVFDQLINRAADYSHLDRDVISRLLWKRENMMSTGVGNGLGLPHIRVENMGDPLVLVGVCVNEITDYQTQDGKPVRVIVFIAASDDDQEAYLQLLSSVSSRMRDPELLAGILENVTKPAQVLKLIKAEK